MASFSFDIVSTYDKAEMNNVFQQVQRDIGNRYDFKGTPAAVEWLGDKEGFKVTAANDMHLESIQDIIRRVVISRNQSTKLLDETKEPVQGSMQMTKEMPFIDGLDQDKAKQVTALIREKFPKVKPQIQGQEVRVQSAKKDELQAVMQGLKQADFPFPLSFQNFR
ncbi:MAG: YajQ family cyclic di-GMP-binding protein [Candidatus Saccharimonadales bacterium]